MALDGTWLSKFPFLRLYLKICLQEIIKCSDLKYIKQLILQALKKNMLSTIKAGKIDASRFLFSQLSQ